MQGGEKNEEMEKGIGMVAECYVYIGDGTDTEYTCEGNNY